MTVLSILWQGPVSGSFCLLVVPGLKGDGLFSMPKELDWDLGGRILVELCCLRTDTTRSQP